MKKPLVSDRHKQLRCERTKEHKDWMEEQSREVVFSYESKFNIVGLDGQQWYRKRCGETLNNRVVSTIVKHEWGSIVVWDCVSWECIGELTINERKSNSKHHLNILHDVLSMSVMKFRRRKKRSGCSNVITTQNMSTIRWFNDHAIIYSTAIESTVPWRESYWTSQERSGVELPTL